MIRREPSASFGQRWTVRRGARDRRAWLARDRKPSRLGARLAPMANRNQRCQWRRRFALYTLKALAFNQLIPGAETSITRLRSMDMPFELPRVTGICSRVVPPLPARTANLVSASLKELLIQDRYLTLTVLLRLGLHTPSSPDGALGGVVAAGGFLCFKRALDVTSTCSISAPSTSAGVIGSKDHTRLHPTKQCWRRCSPVAGPPHSVDSMEPCSSRSLAPDLWI